MDAAHSEIEALCALSSEITSTAAKLHPSGRAPHLGSLNNEPINHISIRYEASFPLTFDDGTEWVINFPLFSQTHPELVPPQVNSSTGSRHNRMCFNT